MAIFWPILALLSAPRALAASDAFALVSQAIRAKAAATYQGRQTIIWSLPAAQGGGTAEIVTALSHCGLRSRMTYLFPPSAAGRVMVDDGVQTSLYEPHRHCILVGPSVSRDTRSDGQAMLRLMRRNYTCIVVRRERLNGKLCAVVAIRPRVLSGPYKLCWINLAQPFVLRLEEYDRTGCRNYVSAYDSISFSPALAGGAFDLPPVARSAPRRTVRELSTTVSFAAPARLWKRAGFIGQVPACLPPGYSLLRLSLLTPSPSAPPLVQIRCSDGLQTLMITESRAVGPTPSAAAINCSLARYGQQAWMLESRGVRIMVRGDLSLPPDIGVEMLHALMPGTEQRLARAFKHQFGQVASKEVGVLRQAGWDYIEIVSAALFLHEHPSQVAVFHALLGKQQPWPAVACKMHADANALDTQARAWIATVR